ncbi:hypothetical protein D5H75_11620 [Bailinhaonella thermotolerans]|uniref:histidine kinase n=2 Tax=Bailinhaonella thermotolerans TaxID=1070861 RepID=A0A3A4ATW3_9ACTN|nr:hypothetical protein D5H75_11620 [Bailinhaonella thermotolerans]
MWAVLGTPVCLAGLTSLPGRYPWPEVALWLAALAAALLLRRSRPVTALLAGALSWEAALVLHGPESWLGILPLLPALPVLAYLAGVRTADARRALPALAASVVPGAVAGHAVVSAAGILLGCLVPWLAGQYRRQRAELVRAGWERAERLEREQRAAAERARLRERARIASDMHDLLGHELSLIALRAGALEVAPGLAEPHRESAAQLREAVTEAAERLREVVRMLRADPHPLPPGTGPGAGTAAGPGAETAAGPGVGMAGPGVETVGGLVRRARDSGLRVHLTGEDPALPPMSARALHRVVQESLTNAARHAPGAEVTVQITETPAEALVTITNPLTRPPSRDGDGTGLLSLEERVRLCGGDLSVRRGPGAFEVRARLPRSLPGGPPPAPPAVRPGAGVPGGVRRAALAPVDAASAPVDAASAPAAAEAAGPAWPAGDAAVLQGSGAARRSASGAGHPARPGGDRAGEPGASRAEEPGAGRTEVARGLAEARGRVRRARRWAVLGAAGSVAGLAAVVLGFTAYDRMTSALEPGDFARLHVGQAREAADRVLPARTWVDRAFGEEPPIPAGAECRYYGTSRNPLDGRLGLYRVCFAGDRVADARRLPPPPPNGR